MNIELSRKIDAAVTATLVLLSIIAVGGVLAMTIIHFPHVMGYIVVGLWIATIIGVIWHMIYKALLGKLHI